MGGRRLDRYDLAVQIDYLCNGDDDEMMNNHDARRILKLEEGNVPLTKNEIHAAFLRSAMQYHPDRKFSEVDTAATPDATKFKECLQAKELLLAQPYVTWQTDKSKQRWRRNNQQNFRHNSSSIFANGFPTKTLRPNMSLRSNIAIRAFTIVFLSLGVAYTEWTKLQNQKQCRVQKLQQQRMAYRNQ